MTRQDHPYARFRRGIETGTPIAEAAARELAQIGLRDALDLVLLYRDDPGRYERAAVKVDRAGCGGAATGALVGGRARRSGVPRGGA